MKKKVEQGQDFGNRTLIVQDKPRPEIAEALQQVERLGIRSIEILTGDNAQSAQALLDSLGGDIDIRIRASWLTPHA